MKNKERCYTIQTNREYLCDSPQPKLQASIYKRLFSLQKIRINPKGLPNDFFRPLVSSRDPSRNIRKHARLNTVSVETEEIRTTPHFQDSVVVQQYQPREYKSEERKDRPEAKTKPFSQQEIKIEKQYTFSQPFFQDKEQRPSKCKSNLHTDKKCVKRGVWEDQNGVSTLEKKELNELASKKYLGKQKYLNWQFIRPKPKNTLPILKARFPSAFGS